MPLVPDSKTNSVPCATAPLATLITTPERAFAFGAEPVLFSYPP